jgi:hypothetical protein
VKAERTNFGHLCIFIGPNASPLKIWPYSEPALTWDVVNDLITALDFLGVCDQCPGRFLGIISQNPSVSKSRGDHSLLYFAYTCVRDLFIGGVIYLAKKIIR